MKGVTKSPYTNARAVLKHEIKDAEFRNEEFKYYYFFYQCEETGNKFTTPEIGDLNLNQIYNQYRERKKIPSLEQIVEARVNYNLSAYKMSTILGFGVNTYSKYERGEIPTPANGDILRIACEPENFREEFVKIKEDLFEKKQLDKLYERLDKLIEKRNQKREILNEIWSLWDNSTIPTENTGFKAPSFNKFANMVIFFIQKEAKRAFASRLNKLLFYSDFLNFKRTGFSISGAVYHANTWGTVPIKSHIAFSVLRQLNKIDTEPAFINNSEEVIERFILLGNFDLSLFTQAELNIMNEVYEKFKEIETKDLINKINHKEKAWVELIEGRKRISYQKYAFELKAI